MRLSWIPFVNHGFKFWSGMGFKLHVEEGTGVLV